MLNTNIKEFKILENHEALKSQQVIAILRIIKCIISKCVVFVTKVNPQGAVADSNKN